jgi:hypothetical protein
MRQAISDHCRRCLEAIPVPLWPHPYDRPTVRAAIPSQPQRLKEAVEAPLGEAMPPHPPPALGAPRRPWPREPLTHLENPLDARLYPEYQISTLVVGGKPPLLSVGRVLLHPSHNPNPKTQKASPRRLQIMRYLLPSGQPIVKIPPPFISRQSERQQSLGAQPDQHHSAVLPGVKPEGPAGLLQGDGPSDGENGPGSIGGKPYPW